VKNLKKLSAAALLTLVLGLSAFAGETQTPPCSQPDPGETQTPPCAAAPGNMGTSTVASNETSFTEIAANVLLNVLPLF
jgi:hypothetical protein